jgi:hypothetical protein
MKNKPTALLLALSICMAVLALSLAYYAYAGCQQCNTKKDCGGLDACGNPGDGSCKGSNLNGTSYYVCGDAETGTCSNNNEHVCGSAWSCNPGHCNGPHCEGTCGNPTLIKVACC